MPVDDSSLMPQPPPPRPARRDEAIAVAMRRFDGGDEPRATPKAARRRGFGARPQFGALVTASLIVAIGLPAALIAIRDSQAPPPPAPEPVAARPAAPAADSAEVSAPQEPEPVQARGPPAPPATMPAPNRRMALSDAADEGLGSSSPVASYAAAPPPPPSAAPAAPPPPPPPPPSPARSEREAVAASEADAGDSQIVVTGSMIAAPNALDQQLRDGRGRSNASPMKSMAQATAPKWVLDDPAYRGFLERLQSAVRANDRAAVVRLVRLPLRVNFARGAKTYRDGRSVLAEYERIFTPEVRSAILSQRFENLFGRDQGVMIGNGAIWFDHVCRNPTCTPPGPVRIHAINP